MDLRNYTQSVFDQELVRQVCVETSDYGFANPETGLTSFLYSHLPTRKAIDVGAYVGDITEALLKTGYEVYGFEPYAPVYEKLVRRLGEDNRFHPFPYAIGCIEGEMPLHLAKAVSNGHQWGDATVFNSLTSHSMPETMLFAGTTMVTVKNLAGLHKSHVIPEDVSLVNEYRKRPERNSAVRAAPFAVLPSGTLDEDDDRRFLARLSLPSRVPYMMATAHIPFWSWETGRRRRPGSWNV